jgi:hypothetical protein
MHQICQTNLPRIDPSPLSGPFDRLFSTVLIFDDGSLPIVSTGFLSGCSNGRPILDRSDADKLKMDEV